MNGFGFIEYKDALDARDVVPGESSTVIQDAELADTVTAFRKCLSPRSLVSKLIQLRRWNDIARRTSSGTIRSWLPSQ